ncbi:DNA-processing protein DprA [Actinomadura sp. HBU206391]|uniref:DNA-processing protein DprA n=1 Tax=Actinomadura sp. HBU206391 TaxID=2731692 RepID=UPI00164EF694|nr:DNA-processing protein DprA [Actinomadura sp. HBU206391]MBC6460863.1 DNA-protecting protein DprA [Actinomadura sp. HBU206391]
MTVPDDERFARATLCHIAEPCDRLLGRMVQRFGAVGALDAIRAGQAPPGFVSGEPESRRLDEHMAWWRVRLPSADPEADLTVCAKLGGRMICPGEPEWPTQLDALRDRVPYALWLRGPADLRYTCLRSIAMVGARAATSYGTRVAADMSAELADLGCTVVSGGALGIDAAAHRGALAAGGTTVAVLANGVDRSYPPRNDGLLAEIAQTSLVVSEWPPGTSPTRLRFLVRNRVIAALTKGTVVVEADIRSGALNTAKFARELNRPVMAVPGPVSSVVSRGCHRWLRDGIATCVSSAAEVMDTVGRIGDDLAPEPRGPVLPRDELEPVTRRVLEAVPGRGAAGSAQIAVRAGVDLDTARSRLGLLSAAGFIERRGQGWRLPRAPRKGSP